MAALILLIFCQCAHHSSNSHEGHDHSTEPHQHAEDEHHQDEKATEESQSATQGDEIIITPQQAANAGIVVTEIQPSQFQQIINTSGQIMTAQGDEAVTVATVSGVVKFNSTITSGKSVKQGSSLLTISSNNIVDGDPVQRARIAYTIAKKEYERAQSLVSSLIISQKEFEQTQQNYEIAKINYEALSGDGNGNGVNIKSPIAGYVKNVWVNEGDYVTIGEPLVSITQNQKLFLRADVSEKYYPLLNTIRTANFQTPYDNKVYELQKMGGKLLSAGKSAESNSFFVPIIFEFNNQGNIIPGSFVDVYLFSTPIPNVIVIPQTSLTEEQGSFFVYLQLDKEGYKKQEVTLGGNNGVDVHILSGLNFGDKVVTKGAYQVRLASASTAIPSHGHEH